MGEFVVELDPFFRSFPEAAGGGLEDLKAVELVEFEPELEGGSLLGAVSSEVPELGGVGVGYISVGGEVVPLEGEPAFISKFEGVVSVVSSTELVGPEEVVEVVDSELDD